MDTKVKGGKRAEKNPAKEKTPRPAAKPKAPKIKNKLDPDTAPWIVSLITGGLALAFVLIAQNAINHGGYFLFELFGIKEKIPVPNVDLIFTIAAGVFSLASLGTGAASYFLKEKNRSGIRWIPGALTVILTVMCLLTILV